MNQFGAFIKSVSAFASSKSQLPTYQGYDRFLKAASIPHASSDLPVIETHMQEPSYVTMHAHKLDTENKTIALNDLKEGIKLSILSDIYRDQRLVMFSEEFKKQVEKANTQQFTLKNKRKTDHIMFDRYLKHSREEKGELEKKV